MWPNKDIDKNINGGRLTKHIIGDFPSDSWGFLNCVYRFIMIPCQILACLDFRDISLLFWFSHHQEEKRG